MERIEYHRYTLRSRDSLNARSSRREHEGALIRIDGGHGCIHPWPELGDEPLPIQLRILSKGGRTPLIEGAFNCVEMDRSGRQNGVSLPPGLIPESHWLVRAGDDPDFAAGEGFRYAKIKGSPSLSELRETMRRWVDAGLHIRLDFNESLPEGEFLPFWNDLSEVERNAIEFVEDPETFSERGWQELRDAGVPVAVDRFAERRLLPGDTLIIKPARPDWCMSADTPCAITSYMDHAVGQMFAAHSAASIYKGELSDQRLACGLLTHRCFENDEFFERVRCDGPRLLPVEGTGLGFDDLLEKLPWKRLN